MTVKELHRDNLARTKEIIAIAIYDLSIALIERLDKFLEKTEKSVFEHVFGKK